MHTHLNGELMMEDGNGHYILDNYDLSALLEKIYFSEDSRLHIKIDSDSRSLFDERGELIYEKNECGMWVFHINGCCLDDVLYDSVEEDINIVIDAKVEEDINEYKKVCNS